jgi:hypothetical protein
MSAQKERRIKQELEKKEMVVPSFEVLSGNLTVE